MLCYTDRLRTLPLPRRTAAQYADAGLYWDGAYKCSFCEPMVGTDPYAAHAGDCPWGIAVCGPKLGTEPTAAALAATYRGAPFAPDVVRRLALCNLHYFPEPGLPDQVRCESCGIKIDRWEPSDDPFELHKAKDCPARRAAHQTDLQPTIKQIRPILNPALTVGECLAQWRDRRLRNFEAAALPSLRLTAAVVERVAGMDKP